MIEQTKLITANGFQVHNIKVFYFHVVLTPPKQTSTEDNVLAMFVIYFVVLHNGKN